MLIIISIECFSQSNSCEQPNYFCSGSTNSFIAPFNEGNAELGPDYGCLNSQPNPQWYLIQSAANGDFSFEIYSIPSRDIDFICWGPFDNSQSICNQLSTCVGNQGSHQASGPGGGYPNFNTVDCSSSNSNIEWCYIPQAKMGEYYLLFISNFSNQNCEIFIDQINYGEIGASYSTCNMSYCYFMGSDFNFKSCSYENNTFSVTGKIAFQGTPSCGLCIITDEPSGISQIINPPYDYTYNLNNIPMDGLNHTLTYFFPNLSNTYYDYYIAPQECNHCQIDAGPDISVCGLEANLNAVETTNLTWLLNDNICFSSRFDANTIAIADTFGIYYLIYQTIDSLNFICSDTIVVEFIDPALCTSIKLNLNDSNLNVFPNPSTEGIVKIKYTHIRNESLLIKIINLQGNDVYQRILNTNNNSNELIINTTFLKNGMYIIELNNNYEILRKPIIVLNSKK